MTRFYSVFVAGTLDYLLRMLPGFVLAAVLFFALRPWRIRRLARQGLESRPLREAVLLLFWLFCGGMAVLTLTPYWFHWLPLLQGRRPIHPPFFTLGSWELTPTLGLIGQSGSYLWTWTLYILLGNIVMFLPFGFFAALLWRGYHWRRALLTGVCVTGFIECWQLLVGRAFDINDLLLNTFGVLCGYWLCLAAKRVFPRLTARFHLTPKEDIS